MNSSPHLRLETFGNYALLFVPVDDGLFVVKEDRHAANAGNLGNEDFLETVCRCCCRCERKLFLSDV